jgi:hypothetical protein
MSVNKREKPLMVTREDNRILGGGKKFISTRKGEQYDSLRYEREFSKIVRSSTSELNSINRYYPADYVERDVNAQDKIWKCIVHLHRVTFGNGEHWSEYRTAKLLRDLRDNFYQLTTKRIISKPQFETCFLRVVRGCTNANGTLSDEKLLMTLDGVYHSMAREDFDWRLFLCFFHVALDPSKNVNDQLLLAFAMIGDKSSYIDLSDLGLVLFPLVRANAANDMLSLMDDAWAQVKTSDNNDIDENLESTLISADIFHKMLRQRCFQRYFNQSDSQWGRGRIFPVFISHWEEELYSVTLIQLVRQRRREQSIIEKLSRDRHRTKLAVWRQWLEYARYQSLLRATVEHINCRIELLRKHRGLLAFVQSSARQHAALQIQRVGRGHIGRNVARQCWTVSYSATLIQTHFRMYLAQNQLQSLASKYIWATIQVQRYTRGALGRRLALTRLLNLVDQEHMKNVQRMERLELERGVASLTKLQALWRRKIAIAKLASMRMIYGREMQIQRDMEASRQLFLRERQIYERQLEQFYKSLREEQENTNQIQSKIAHDQVMVNTLRRRLNFAELKHAPPDNSEQLATEKWLVDNQAKVESEVKATISHCIHCLDQPDNTVEKQTRSAVMKRVKERVPHVLNRADERHIPMETKEAQQIARDEIIQLIAEEERAKLDNQMKEEFTKRERRKAEEKMHAAAKEKEANARATIYAVQVVAKACRKWLARKELRRLCLETYERIFDVQSHAFYYRNKVSGEASWTKPKAMGVFEIPAKDEWKLLRDAHNFPYYFNPYLMEMRWTPPCNEHMCCGIVPYTWWREHPIPTGACPNFGCILNKEDGTRYCEECFSQYLQ